MKTIEPVDKISDALIPEVKSMENEAKGTE
jgi:hypothetical protein